MVHNYPVRLHLYFVDFFPNLEAYTKMVAEIEEGNLQAWKTTPAPLIAKNYWHLDEGATVMNVFQAIRADEAHHRY